MNKAERIKIANAEWHRLNDIDKKIDVCLSKLMYEVSLLEYYERKYSGYWYNLKLKKCNALHNKIEMLIESKGV